jgi:hypothetical protein
MIAASRWIAMAMIAPSIIAPVGCGGPPVATVTGLVEVDGTPLKMGFISLEPARGAVPPASAVIAAGRFSIGAAHGMQPGDYVVRIGAPDLERCDPTAPPNPAKPIVPLLAAPWNNASALTVTVQPGANRLDITGRRDGPPTRQP